MPFTIYCIQVRGTRASGSQVSPVLAPLSNAVQSARVSGLNGTERLRLLNVTTEHVRLHPDPSEDVEKHRAALLDAMDLEYKHTIRVDLSLIHI